MSDPVRPVGSAGFRAASASGGGWAQIAKACLQQLEPLPDGANLGFLYVTDALSGDLPSLLTFLRERTRVADWVGCVGLGICATGAEIVGVPAATVLVAALPADSFRVFGPVSRDFERFRRDHGEWLERRQPTLAVVHGDPRAAELLQAVPALADASAAFLVGGLGSGEGVPLQIAGRTVEGGLSGVMLTGELPLVTGLTQGCSPIGPARQVTAAGGNVVAEIDGRPALDVLKGDIGELLSRDLRRAAGRIFAAFPVAGSDTADYLVRNIVGIDLDRRLLAVGAPVAVGDRLLFCRRDPASALRDLERMLGDLKRRAPGMPRAGLYFSCVARGPNQFGPDSAELGMIRDALGDFPLAGFFANGEISNDRLYGYTGVLTLFL
jgi:small ligand-binding sensory domain FIST